MDTEHIIHLARRIIDIALAIEEAEDREQLNCLFMDMDNKIEALVAEREA